LEKRAVKSHLIDSSLRLSDVDLLSVLSDFDEGVIIASKDGTIIYYNQAQSKIDDLDPEYALGKKVTALYNLDEESSMIFQCIKKKQPIIGRLFFYKTKRGRTANTIHSVYPLIRGDQILGAVCFVKNYDLLEKTLSSISSLRPDKKIDLGNGTCYQFSDLIGKSEQFLKVLQIARLSAATPSPVMFFGETGTGKELFAQSLHNYSSRKKKKFIAINCSAIPENLLEGLLFGTRRGAFTGSEDKAGLFEQANLGSLFLDEINSMPIDLQTKLLRVLQERKVRRLGGTNDVEIDVKIISSVNSDPHKAIKEGHLRMDLFYRLGVVFIRIPPLKERKDDIALLANHFVYKNNLALGKNIKGVSNEVLDFFSQYDWPGNIRELEHIIEGTMNVMAGDEMIRAANLPLHFIHPDFREIINQNRKNGLSLEDSDVKKIKYTDQQPPPVVREYHNNNHKNLKQIQTDQEKEVIEKALIEYRGNVTQAAKSLGLSRQLLHYKIKKHTIDKNAYMKQ
jgi:arginine utilization regulatory protein